MEETPHLRKRMRSVRKGTRSCWACRRRKVRCTFADPSDATCTGCRRRSVRCVGQELPDDSFDSGTVPVGSRLGRVEAMIEQLARRLDGQDGTVSSALLHLTSGHTPDSARLRTELLPSPSLSTDAHVPPLSHLPGGDADVLQALRDAWPSQQDLDIVLSIPIPISRLFHGLILTSYATFIHEPLPNAVELLQMPARGSHPAVAARRLLLLCTYLQNIPSSHPVLSHLGVGYQHMTHRAFEAATRLVTSNDRLVESVEGVECIMMESMFHNNAGNLRRAWLVLRRAIGIAQLMGLDKRSLQGSSCSRPPVKMVDSERTRLRVDPGRMWFQLITSDRYLSLMLGFPVTVTNEDCLLQPRVLEGCTAMERMERMLVVACGRILRRNSYSQAIPYNGEDNVMETDLLLQQAAATMPPKWWLIPSPRDASSALDETDVEYDEEGKEMRTTTRLMNQMAHYHLLIRLHLPYLLRVTASNQHVYSRTTAVDASRELLARYISFRLSPSFHQHSSSQSGPTIPPPYCRGVDFLAFVASTVLCLMSIDARRPRQPSDPSDLPFSLHRRSGDRGMMEHTLEIMERMAECNSDAIATRVASILGPLLAIEADMAAKVTYTLDTEPDCEQEELECGGCVGGEGDVHIRIPHLGTINIDTERHGCFRSIDVCDEIARRHDGGSDESNRMSRCELQELSLRDDDQGHTIDMNDWALQGVDLALFEGLVDRMEERETW